MPLRPEPSPKAIVTRLRPVTWKTQLLLGGTAWGERTAHLTFVWAPPGPHGVGISLSLHVGFCKSDSEGSWSELTARARGPPTGPGNTPGAGWLGRRQTTELFPALDPAGPGAALGLWLDSTAQVWSPEPGWTLLQVALAGLSAQDRTPSRGPDLHASHPAAVWHTVLSPTQTRPPAEPGFPHLQGPGTRWAPIMPYPRAALPPPVHSPCILSPTSV